MIADLDAIQFEAPLECDVCVIGTGAAGLALASELLRTKLRIVVLEGGGLEQEAAAQELYGCAMTGLPFAGAHTGRHRVFGGSTTCWGGQSLPMSALDFQHRSWVRNSGWPIGWDDLAPYYVRANEFLGIDQFDYRGDLFAMLNAREPGFDAHEVDYHVAKWSPRPDVRQTYVAELRRAGHVTLLLHANATTFELDDARRTIHALRASSLRGRAITVRARYYALCCGGIENARVLLANDAQQPRGIGNEHDLVGRYLQDHPAARIGVMLGDDVRIQRVFNQFHRRGKSYSIRCSAGEELQRAEEILNVSATFMFDVDGETPYALLRSAYHKLHRGECDRELAALLARCTMHANELARPIYEYYVRGRTWTPRATVGVIVNSEQEPDPGNRVTLSDDRDALGTRRAIIHWEPTELTYRTIRTFAQVLKKECRRTGVGELVFSEWVREHSADWRGYISDQNHHIGTTRMHPSPRHGVVDVDCRVHGTTNLFVGGSSVFPNGGHSNPTLTLIALALRMADGIQRLARTGIIVARACTGAAPVHGL